MQFKLLQARKLANLTQEDVAKILGINRQSYTNKETGKYPFTLDEMFKLSQYFGVKMEDLFMPRNTTKRGKDEN